MIIVRMKLQYNSWMRPFLEHFLHFYNHMTVLSLIYLYINLHCVSNSCLSSSINDHTFEGVDSLLRLLLITSHNNYSGSTLLYRELQDYSLGQIVFQALFAITQLLAALPC